MGFCTPSQRREHFTKLNENLSKGSEDTEKFRVTCGQMDGRIDRRRALFIPFRFAVGIKALSLSLHLIRFSRQLGPDLYC